MLTVEVCVGSGCHLKGSYDVITTLQALIADRNLEEKVLLKGVFCLGNCVDGVSVRVNGEIITGISLKNMDDFFAGKILQRLEE